jgi:hypothetical protein
MTGALFFKVPTGAVQKAPILGNRPRIAKAYYDFFRWRVDACKGELGVTFNFSTETKYANVFPRKDADGDRVCGRNRDLSAQFALVYKGFSGGQRFPPLS